MTSASTQAIELALEHHRAGRLAAAEQIYGQVLQADPTNVDALHLLGIIAHERGKHDLAVELIDKAVRLDPANARLLTNLGEAYRALGRLAEAVASYERALAAKPDFVDALNNCGLALHGLGSYEAALASYDKALALSPAFAEAWSNRGNALSALKRYEEALDSYGRALRLRPDFVDALMNRSIALERIGRYEEALASLDGVLAFNPGHAEALRSRGNVLLQLRRCEEALDSYDRALGLAPGLADTWSNRGLTLYRLARYEEALASLERALAINPRYPEALSNRGNALLRLRRCEEAVDSYDKALSLRPDFADAWSNRGLALYQLGRYEQALASLDRALALNPDYAEALNNRGNVLSRLCRWNEALESCGRALVIRPDFAEAWTNRGNVLGELNRYGEALECYAKALAIKPDDAQAHWNESLCRLLIGDFERGWEKYEWRWQLDDFDPQKRHLPPSLWLRRQRFDFPEWDGTALAGKTLLVYSEQGIGDEIMFASCIPDVLAKGGKYVLECSPKLTALYQRSFPQARVIPAYADQHPDWRARLAEVDCQIAIGSLPRALGFGGASFPRPAGYLRPDPARIEYWKSKMAPRPKLNIGVSWRGGIDRTLRGLRSVAINELAPLWRLQGCHFVSLQYGEVGEELAAVRREFGVTVDHPPRIGIDLDDAAALICALDVVISVTTTVVHLTGALDRTAWVMVPFAPEWRYGMRGERMPWYPKVRLFRQPRPLEWQPVVAAIVQELEALRGKIGLA